MGADSRRARDLALLDGVDALPREHFTGNVWRVARESRDPIQGSASESRWCNGEFDVLYTCLQRDGAISEIFSLLNAQPVFPSKLRAFVHKLEISVEHTLRLADQSVLGRLGVDVDRYGDRDYAATQAIADAAFFLGFDGLLVPSARAQCLNAVLFTDRLAPTAIKLVASEPDAIDWDAWRRTQRRR